MRASGECRHFRRGLTVQFDPETKKPLGIDNTPAHIKAYATDSATRLGFTPDLYYLHRVDPKGNLVEAVKALNELKSEGKCRYIGLSECSADTLRKACSGRCPRSSRRASLTVAVAHIDALQIEYSLFALDHEQNGLLAAARELGVTVVAFGPLGKGILTGAYKETTMFGDDDYRKTIPQWSEANLDRNLDVVRMLERLAEKKACTVGQLAIAWVMAQGAIPIPGTKSITRLEENFGARDVDLTDADLRDIRQILDRNPVQGAR